MNNPALQPALALLPFKSDSAGFKASLAREALKGSEYRPAFNLRAFGGVRMLKSAIADGIRLLVALVLIGLGLMLAKDYVAPADESRLDTAEADNTILRVDG